MATIYIPRAAAVHIEKLKEEFFIFESRNYFLQNYEFEFDDDCPCVWVDGRHGIDDAIVRNFIQNELGCI